MLTLSLIIPVYNEERHMKACLDAVSKQATMPDEVLVIDNNCSDATIDIAKQYDFVTIIKEPKQGLIAARDRGFNSAIGDILGRIDADSVIAPDWVQVVLATFEQQKDVSGVTGLAQTYLFPFARRFTPTNVSKSYLQYVEADYGVGMLWGANMAIRSQAWQQVKGLVHSDDSQVHEDQDISCCFSRLSLPIVRNNRLLMRSDDDSLSYLPKFIEYDKRRINTKKLHKNIGSIGGKKRTVRNPLRVLLSLTLGNIFRLYFWVGGTILLALHRRRAPPRI
jgi:glycosyltransferase involved in cell wall biosynthesis